MASVLRSLAVNVTVALPEPQVATPLVLVVDVPEVVVVLDRGLVVVVVLGVVVLVVAGTLVEFVLTATVVELVASPSVVVVENGSDVVVVSTTVDSVVDDVPPDEATLPSSFLGIANTPITLPKSNNPAAAQRIRICTPPWWHLQPVAGAMSVPFSTDSRVGGH